MKYESALWFALALGLTGAPADVRACAQFGPDTAAVEAVASYEATAQEALDNGHYNAALSQLRKAEEHVAGVANPHLRKCVEEGIQLREVVAIAGQKYLSLHPNDLKGARKEADSAWRAFPQSKDCP